MKLEDCKIGTIVLATKKSYSFSTMEEFLGEYPLGIAKITYVGNKRIEVVDIRYYGKNIYSFLPEDLTEIK